MKLAGTWAQRAHKHFTSHTTHGNLHIRPQKRLFSQHTHKGQELLMEQSFSSLRERIGFISTEEEKIGYETPWRGGVRGHSKGVFLPKTTDEVQEIIRMCHEHKWPVIPQGGNTGLVFGSTPPEHVEKPPFIINLGRMNTLVGDVDPLTSTICVQGGMILENFKNQMEDKGYLFSVDMGSKGSAQLAGAASTNAGGTNFLRYGGMREQVVGLKAVLPDGRLLDTISHVQKDNTGFPLAPLFLGAEGALGIITELKLKLHPLPKQKETALLAMQGIEASVALLQKLKHIHGEELSAFELISDTAYQIVVGRPGKVDPFSGQQDGEPYSHYVLVELTSHRERTEHYDLSQLLMTQVEQGFESGVIRNAIIEKPHILWGIRESISESASHAGIVIPNDISVPIPEIPAFLTAVGQEVSQKWPELGLKIGYFGHLGDGNLHYNLVQPKGIQPKVTPEQKQEIEDYVSGRVIAFGGSPVAEHGIGTKNIHALQSYKNPVALEVMMQIKQALDPHNIMNPYVFFGRGITGKDNAFSL